MKVKTWTTGPPRRTSAYGPHLGRFSRWLWAIALVALLGISTVAVTLDSPLTQWPPPPNAKVVLPPSQLLGAPDSAKAAHWRLRHRPIDAAAIITLAEASKREDGVAGALPLYELAVHRAPRDAGMRERLFGLLLSARDYPRALIQLDAWLRLDPVTAQGGLAHWVATSDRGMLSDLGRRLANDPPWRLMVWEVIGRQQLPGKLRVILEAIAASRPLKLDEVSLLAPLLEQAGEAPRARRVWAQALPDGYHGFVREVYDGGFELPDGPEPYGWRSLGQPVGYFAGRVPSRTGSGLALALEFLGREIRFAPIQQALAAEPGQYQLSVLVRANLEGDADKFAWVISCRAPLGLGENHGSGPRLVAVSIPRETHGWQRITADFRIDADCPLQLVQFAHWPPRAAPHHISGTLAMDELELNREGAS